MTAGKSFKRLVRERAARTGESYTAALRHFRGPSAESDPMESIAFRRVEKPDLGFALQVPEDWQEQPSNPAVGSEVARFSSRQGNSVRLLLVFWSPMRSQLTPRAQAESMLPGIESQGYRELVLSDVRIANRPAIRLDCERRRDAEIFSVQGYLVFAGRGFFAIALGTHDLDRDRELLDGMADRFEVLEPHDRVSVEDMALP